MQEQAFRQQTVDQIAQAFAHTPPLRMSDDVDDANQSWRQLTRSHAGQGWQVIPFGALTPYLKDIPYQIAPDALRSLLPLLMRESILNADDQLHTTVLQALERLLVLTRIGQAHASQLTVDEIEGAILYIEANMEWADDDVTYEFAEHLWWRAASLAEALTTAED